MKLKHFGLKLIQEHIIASSKVYLKSITMYTSYCIYSGGIVRCFTLCMKIIVTRKFVNLRSNVRYNVIDLKEV